MKRGVELGEGVFGKREWRWCGSRGIELDLGVVYLLRGRADG